MNTNGIGTAFDSASSAMETDVMESSEPVQSIGARIASLKEMFGHVRRDLFDEASSSSFPASLPKCTSKASLVHLLSSLKTLHRQENCAATYPKARQSLSSPSHGLPISGLPMLLFSL